MARSFEGGSNKCKVDVNFIWDASGVICKEFLMSAYYENGAFYIITYALSNKVTNKKQLRGCCLWRMVYQSWHWRKSWT